MTKSLGMILLAIWLILVGGMPLFGIHFPHSSTVIAIIAVIAGILILLGK
jgi:hypothetical protein